MKDTNKTYVWDSEKGLYKILTDMDKNKAMNFILSGNVSDLAFIKRSLLKSKDNIDILEFIDKRISEIINLRSLIKDKGE
jgi:hypothetical protein